MPFLLQKILKVYACWRTKHFMALSSCGKVSNVDRRVNLITSSDERAVSKQFLKTFAHFSF